MALTSFQRGICRLIADNRIRSGESYVAGAVPLNEITRGTRISQDIDLFHDTSEAVAETFALDRDLIEGRGFSLTIRRSLPGFVEALVQKGEDRTSIQWTSDSAYRFFPLLTHPDFGLTLHPVDLATNKVLALVGRLEPRDWVDVIRSHANIQPLGLLAWAASGKDPAFSPSSILAQAKRTARYTGDELSELAFDGPPPDAAFLAQQWRTMLAEAEEMVSLLPPSESGKCVLTQEGSLFVGRMADLRLALERDGLFFHRGRVRGAFPTIGG